MPDPRTNEELVETVRDTVTEWWETKPYEPGNPFFDLAELARRLERAEEEIARYKIGVGPDDPAGCPAGHGDQCCGWHDACRAALRAAEGADE